MHMQSFFSSAEEAMKKTIDRLKCELSSIRTGRASSAIIETIKVESYDSIMPINQIASISVPDARTVEIRPWDVVLLLLSTCFPI